MKSRWLRFAPAALATLLAGCLLVSGQILIDFELDDTDVTPNALTALGVNLNTISDYVDHKADLQGVVDMAVVGRLNNTGTADIGVVVWITPDVTAHATETALKADPTAKQLWGPFAVASGGSIQVDWDASAGLFTDDGKALLLQEVKGDGIFTLYFLGDAGSYSFEVRDGFLILVIDTQE
jgi:hypothetical protein